MKDLSRHERKVDQTENTQEGIINTTQTVSRREYTLNDTPQVKKGHHHHHQHAIKVTRGIYYSGL